MELTTVDTSNLATIKVIQGGRTDDHVRATIVVFEGRDVEIKMTKTEAYLLASSLMDEWRRR